MPIPIRLPVDEFEMRISNVWEIAASGAAPINGQQDSRSVGRGVASSGEKACQLVPGKQDDAPKRKPLQPERR